MSTGLIEAAAALATREHGAINHVRKYTGEPYIVHPEEVASIVDAVPGRTDAMVAAAWMHDVLEDTPFTEEMMRAELSEFVDGNDAVTLVMWLTDVSKPEDGNRKFRKDMDREHSMAAPAEAQTVKYADLISNTASITKYDKDFAELYMKEKRLLLEGMTKGDATLLATAWRHVVEYEESLVQDALAGMGG